MLRVQARCAGGALAVLGGKSQAVDEREAFSSSSSSSSAGSRVPPPPTSQLHLRAEHDDPLRQARSRPSNNRPDRATLAARVPGRGRVESRQAPQRPPPEPARPRRQAPRPRHRPSRRPTRPGWPHSACESLLSSSSPHRDDVGAGIATRAHRATLTLCTLRRTDYRARQTTTSQPWPPCSTAP